MIINEEAQLHTPPFIAGKMVNINSDEFRAMMKKAIGWEPMRSTLYDWRTRGFPVDPPRHYVWLPYKKIAGRPHTTKATIKEFVATIRTIAEKNGVEACVILED